MDYSSQYTTFCVDPQLVYKLHKRKWHSPTASH